MQLGNIFNTFIINRVLSDMIEFNHMEKSKQEFQRSARLQTLSYLLTNPVDLFASQKERHIYTKQQI